MATTGYCGGNAVELLLRCKATHVLLINMMNIRQTTSHSNGFHFFIMLITIRGRRKFWNHAFILRHLNRREKPGLFPYGLQKSM